MENKINNLDILILIFNQYRKYSPALKELDQVMSRGVGIFKDLKWPKNYDDVILNDEVLDAYLDHFIKSSLKYVEIYERRGNTVMTEYGVVRALYLDSVPEKSVANLTGKPRK